MKDKTILGAWCSEPNCIFIDHKHIQTKVMVHIWYSYDDDSKTDVLNKEISFVKEIDFDEFNNIVEISDENKIPSEIKALNNVGNVQNMVEFADKQQLNNHIIKDRLNEIIHYLQYLKSKGDE